MVRSLFVWKDVHKPQGRSAAWPSPVVKNIKNVESQLSGIKKRVFIPHSPHHPNFLNKVHLWATWGLAGGHLITGAGHLLTRDYAAKDMTNKPCYVS